MDKCVVCEHWLQLPHNGEDICQATKDENDMAMVIPPTGEIPEWCPKRNTCGKHLIKMGI
jgi:hypothetical protein